PVPVPTILASEETGSVMDAPFYVMGYVEGVVATSELPEAIDDPAGRRTVAGALVDTLAALHGVDHRAAGLEDFGRPSNDVGRHLRRFSRIVDAEERGLEGELGAQLEQ